MLGTRLALLLPAALALLATTDAAAQVGAGDIGISGFSSSVFGVLGAGGGATSYTTGGFLGTGSSQTVLWDRTQPNAFLIGGADFVGRATVNGPGSVTYALVSSAVGLAVQLSWDDAGQIVLVDAASNQVRRLDPATGLVVDLSSGAQPWGTDASSGAWEPRTGDVIVGGSGAIYRLPAGSPTALPVVGGLGGFVSGITFDPVTGDIVATVLTANRVVRVDGAANVTDIAPPGSVPGPNALDVDRNGDFVTGGGTGQVYRIPRAGGAPVLLGNHSGPLNGVSVAGAGGYALPFGVSCAASFGPAELRATAPILAGSTLTTTSVNHAANAPGILVLGLSRTSHLGIPLPFLLDPLFGTASCFAHVSLDVTIGGITSAAAPATLAFPLQIPPAFAGQTLYAQHVVVEPVAGSMSWSNALLVRFP